MIIKPNFTGEEIKLNDVCTLQISSDDKGRMYHNFKHKTKIEVCIGLNKNKVYNGFFRIFLRENNSVFGDQVCFQFWIIDNLNNEYQLNTPYKNIEWYMNSKDGILFLKTVTEYLCKMKGV